MLLPSGPSVRSRAISTESAGSQVADESPITRPTRRATVLSALLLLAIVIGLPWAAWYRHEYGTFNPVARPEKFVAYGRQFYNPGAALNRAEMVANAGSPQAVVGALSWLPGITIARPAIWGDPTASCVVVVYLQTGPDQFVPYSLSGGC